MSTEPGPDLDPRFIGAFVAIKVAQNQDMISADAALGLVRCFLQTHDMRLEDDPSYILNHPDINSYVDLVIEKNKPTQ